MRESRDTLLLSTATFFFNFKCHQFTCVWGNKKILALCKIRNMNPVE